MKSRLFTSKWSHGLLTDHISYSTKRLEMLSSTNFSPRETNRKPFKWFKLLTNESRDGSSNFVLLQSNFIKQYLFLELGKNWPFKVSPTYLLISWQKRLRREVHSAGLNERCLSIDLKVSHIEESIISMMKMERRSYWRMSKFKRTDMIE